MTQPYTSEDGFYTVTVDDDWLGTDDDFIALASHLKARVIDKNGVAIYQHQPPLHPAPLVPARPR